MRCTAALCVLFVLSAGGCTKAATLAPAGASEQQLAAEPKVLLRTSHGNIVLRLFATKAPISVQNVLGYVDAGFYDGTIFHRVIPEYVVQGGGFERNLQQKLTRAPIKNEADNGLSNRRGTVALARTNVVDSATSQFFINVRDNPRLDHNAGDFGYAVFGEVVEGMAVVDLIRNLPTRCPTWIGQPCREDLPGGMRDIPIEPVVIEKATRL